MKDGIIVIYNCFVYCEDEALREYLKKMTRK